MRKLTRFMICALASLSLASCDLSSLMGLSIPNLDDLLESSVAKQEESNEQTSNGSHKHKYVEDSTKRVEATCVSEGEIVSYCSVCGSKKEEMVEALGHEWVATEDQTSAIAPTCTMPGTELAQCQRCGERSTIEAAPLGHNMVDDDYKDDAMASCEYSGSITTHCGNPGCTKTGTRRATRGSHAFCETRDPVAPVQDNIGVEVNGETYKGYDSVGYKTEYCPIDYVTRISWDAKQVTTRCKAPDYEHVVTSGHTVDEDAVWEDVLEPHIVESDEGVQYWGRAIGNAQILSETGDSSANDHVHEPNENIEGSFMEYKINLSEPLYSVRLTANLIPARYLSRNDIWRAAGAAADWTPGYQKGIDGEMHIVNDWRFVVFIDGEQIQLDNTVNTKLINSNLANWYTVPMKTMNLSAGEHTVKVSMAGGYRHTFVNWGFETGYQHEHIVQVGEKAEGSALRQVTCGCNKLAGYQLKAAEATSGQLAPSETGTDSAAKNTRLGKNNIFEDVWDITGISTGMYEVYLEARCSNGTKNSGKWKGDGSDVNGNGGTAELASEYKYKVAVGEAPAATVEGEEEATDRRIWVGLGGEYSYDSTGLSEVEKAWTNKALATIPVNSGETTLTIKNMNNGYSIWVYAVRLVKVSDFVY